MVKYLRVCFTALACSLAYPVLCDAQNTSGVSVSVRQQTSSTARVTYHYKVVNRDERTVVAVILGHDYNQGISELSQRPTGWTFEKGLPAGTTTSPAGWDALLVVTEESPYFEIEWRNDGDDDIRPGGVQAGYSVTLAQPDPAYIDGHWTVIFGDASAASGLLAREGQARIHFDFAQWHAATARRWNFSLTASNTGATDARNVRITTIACRAKDDTRAINVKAPTLPITLGPLKAGNSIDVPVELDVPEGVQECELIARGTVFTPRQKQTRFSVTQEIRPKLP